MNRKINVKEDLIGKKFGSLKVVDRDEDHYTKSGNKFPKWLCECECGNIVSVFQSALKSGKQKSCGCKQFTACKKYNEYSVDGNTVKVKLTNSEEIMLCDLEDWERLKIFCWSKGNTGYAEARVNGRTTLFHHLVLQCEKGMVRDHINRNKMDNRKENLRIVTYFENNVNVERANSNPYGVPGAYKNGNRIGVRINVHGKPIYLGTYKTVEEAKEAREKAEEKYYKKIRG